MPSFGVPPSGITGALAIRALNCSVTPVFAMACSVQVSAWASMKAKARARLPVR
jgi:hypothetical protein